MNSPAVSVVIPTYNHARFLRAAIQSVLEQTFTDWEAVIVNNYSEDETVEVIASFADPRIRLVDFRNHGVIAASRNHGIGLARGEYIAFLDSDDVWYPEKLARCMEKLMTGADLVCHGENWVKEGGAARVVHYGPERRGKYHSLLFNGNCISTSATVVRKPALVEVGCFSEDAQFVTAEDYELWLKLAQAGFRFAFIDEVLGEYRLHGGNQSKAVLRNMQAELAVVEKHFAGMESLALTDRLWIRRRRAMAYYGAARGMQADGEHAQALRWLARSWRTYPFIARAYVAALMSLSACFGMDGN